MRQGVDAGRTPLSRLEVLIAPGGARECPYNAHVRILSGSVVLDGVRGDWRVRALHIATCACWAEIRRTRQGSPCAVADATVKATDPPQAAIVRALW